MIIQFLGVADMKEKKKSQTVKESLVCTDDSSRGCPFSTPSLAFFKKEILV